MSTYGMNGLSQCFFDTIMWYVGGRYRVTLDSLDNDQKEELNHVNVAGLVAGVISLILHK